MTWSGASSGEHFLASNPPSLKSNFTVYNALTDGNLSGNGSNEDMAKVAAFIALGGVSYFPDANFKFPTPMTTLVGTRLMGTYRWQNGQGTGTKLTGTAGQNVINLVDSGNAVSETQNFWIEGFQFSGGQDQLYAPNGGVGVTLSQLFFGAPSHAGLYLKGFCQEWFGDQLDWSAGQYGVYFNNEVGHSGTGTPALFDKCRWSNVYMHGQTINGGFIEVALSTDVIWDQLRLVNIAQDGFIIGGGLRAWEFRQLTTEASGYTGSAPKAATVATTASGNAVVTGIGSTTGLNANDVVTIKGAGANGFDWYPTILTVDSGTQLTMTTTAPTTVTGAELVNYLYSDVKIVNAPALPGAILFTNPSWGVTSVVGAVRYALDDAAGSSVTIVGGSLNQTRPIYDQSGAVAVFSPERLPIRRPNNFLTENFKTSSFGGTNAETPRTQIVSPPGKDIVLGLNDSTGNQSGTLGNIEGRRSDSNRTRFFIMDNWGHLNLSRAANTPTTSALNAHVSSATPVGTDHSGTITIVVDATGVAAGQTLFTLNFKQSWFNSATIVQIVDASTDTSLATVRFHATVPNSNTFNVVCDQALTLSKTYIITYIAL